MYNQQEIRYSKNLHEQKEQLSENLFVYLEYLADIQAGITLTVDRHMIIPHCYQIVSPSRRTYDDVVVKPGSYRLRAFREDRGWHNARYRLFDFDRRFVLDIHKTGLENPIPYDVWFKSSQSLAHILKTHLTGSIEIVENRLFPGTVIKLTFTHSNVAEKGSEDAASVQSNP